MEFLDIFNKDDDDEVELKPGERGGYGGFSTGPAESGSSKNKEKKAEKVSRDGKKEARLFPGLGKTDEDDSGKSVSDSRKKTMKRLESKLDKMLKQNKMILEKLEGLDSKSSKSSDDNTVW